MEEKSPFFKSHKPNTNSLSSKTNPKTTNNIVNNISFKKGEEFEKYVEDELFNKKYYALVHRTNSFEQNKLRYSEDTMKPDFKFRCLQTNQEFYVEAKYRSNFNINEMLEIMSLGQLARFNNIQQTENIPVFIAIGYGGIPSAPCDLSLIPLQELKYLDLYPSFLKKFNIEKTFVESGSLNLKKSDLEEVKAINEKENISPTLNKKLKLVKNTKIKYGVGILALLIFIFFSFQFIESSNIEKKLRQRTLEYYQILETGNIDQLENYISPMVNKWYKKTNQTYPEIEIQIIDYLKKYPESRTEIQWDTFEVTALNDDYLVTYKLIYKILSKGKFRNRVYYLKINSVWSSNLKLKSIYEVQI